MPETEFELLKSINQQLEILIYLNLRKHEIEEMNAGEQFVLMRRLGFSDIKIAELFGKSRGYVSSEIVRNKKKVK